MSVFIKPLTRITTSSYSSSAIFSRCLCPVVGNVFTQYEIRRNAGHAHWQNIAKTKAANDQAKSKLIGKLSYKIGVAIRSQNGQTNPDYNPMLRNVLEECRRSNMTKETMERSIKRAVSQKENAKPSTFEFLGPGRVYCIIEAITDNPKRTLNQLNKVAAKLGIMKVSTSGPLMEYFDHRGYACVDKSIFDEEKATELAIEINAEEVTTGYDDNMNEAWKFLGPPTFSTQMKTSLTERGYNVVSDGAEFIPKAFVAIDDTCRALLQEVIKTFEEHEEVQGVHTNAT
ncbi:unnamed protein product [Didymodactylos carnosus]|uniref:Translational activator of cytochrome c oxidase 1 n=1 Tax=Didymodactylos carnosus TaxID=1234261 RepID=A0A813XNS0_9BILA|nr:unnamed protein product [Didymodactylos carnosus]CAF1131822.1 unnamed protein product [Didymodactylos carnosus]CAF3660396.1 unnamed protein product [Didymodactylos carnosus]CAF3915972.1 unnamed protein product [Didymodactylos carnosus]